MKNVPLISASIVTYEHPIGDIQKVINYLNSSSYHIDIFIADNSLSDQLRVLELDNKNVTYFRNKRNIGFGPAHNKALDRIQVSKLHFFVNPDVEIDGREIDMLIEYMQVNPIVGACSPKAIYHDGSIQVMARLIPNFFDLILRRVSILAKIFKHRVRSSECPYFSETPIECYFLHGFFLLVDFKTVKQIGGFDERFFMYMEDLDLLRRISEIKKVYYLPHIKVYHGYNRESAYRLRLLKIHVSSIFKYFNKWGWLIDRNRKHLNKRVILQLNRNK